MSDPLLAALDPESFRADGHRIVDVLADYLREVSSRHGPVLPPRAPDALVASYATSFTERSALAPLVARVLADSNHLHHPRYLGHQVSVPLPQAALCDMVAALLNNGMAVMEMGPAATAMEQACLRWMARGLGLPEAANGMLTSGGSVGNLTALLAAREVKRPGTWENGADARLAILVSEQAHYSVARAARIMGLGAGGVIGVPSDARFRMHSEALAQALEGARARGLTPIAVVASCCSTSTGAFDPLGPIADFCEAHDLWLHVDGAHGGAAAFSSAHGHLVCGIERADSVVIDAHKMLLMPALITAVLYRDGAHARRAFAQQAAYLFGDNAYDSGERTLECTKRAMSLKLYAALSTLGPEVIGAHVSRLFELGARFAGMLREAGDFEVPYDPECNIVCFRHVPEGVSDVDGLQVKIRKRILESGEFYLVQTKLRGATYLRTTLMNPLTSEEDLRALITTVRAAA